MKGLLLSAFAGLRGLIVLIRISDREGLEFDYAYLAGISLRVLFLFRWHLFNGICLSHELCGM